MAIRTVVTRGYGNGTFNGTIALVVTRGYDIAVAVLDSSLNIARSVGQSIVKSVRDIPG